MNRRVVASWCLYDFGNSAFAVLFPSIYGIYYAKTVVGGAAGDQWWGWVNSLSMLCVAITAPLLGGIADHAGLRKRMLAGYTALGVAAVLAFPAVRPGMVLAGFLLGVVANLAFEGGAVFYNSFLPEIAPATHQGRVSGYGFAVGYVGSLVALGCAFVLLANDAAIHAVWVLLAAQWTLAAIPPLLMLPADRRGRIGFLEAGAMGVRNTLRTLREVLRLRDLRRFLLAYFFYEDGVNTAIQFASIYAAKNLGFEDKEVLGLLALLQVAALAGSMAMARPTDLLGPKRVVRATLVWWVAVVLCVYFSRSKATFTVTATLAGLGLGSIQAASRALMSRLIPAGREAEMFGFYSLCGKTGAILGPLLVGLFSRPFGLDKAILVVAAFHLTGFWLLGRVRVTPAAAECSSTGPK